MRPIPPKLRELIAKDPFMKRCIYKSPDAPNRNCCEGIQWEHAAIYARKQINEAWAIVPCCGNHNSGKYMVKDYNLYRALLRADMDDICERYPKRDWRQEFKYLSEKYERIPDTNTVGKMDKG